MLVNVDRAAGRASGSINVTVLVRSQADSSVQVKFKTSGNTASDPTLIDCITRSYNCRMGR